MISQVGGVAAPGPRWALWGRGFRPFFLGVGVYGALFVLAWTAVWRGALRAPAWLYPFPWHGHEMLFGVVAAAIAGFLTTAVPVWTGRPALAGRPLQALFALWLAGRLVMLAAGRLPAALVAAVDVAFLPVLALVLGRSLAGTGQRRNYGIVAIVAALALANASIHAEALGLTRATASRGLRFAVDLVVVLVVVIGGRITPAFTANALRLRGEPAELRSWPALDRLAVAAVVAVAAADLFVPRSVASGVLACVAGLAVAARLAGWQSAKAWRDPLLASLHAGTAWVALGLLLVGAGDLGAGVTWTSGLHALTAGALGSMILAVMTRVALGHTGRPLVLPKGAVGCYLRVHAGAALRVALPLAPVLLQPALMVAAAVVWGAAFALFAVLYAPILTRPRIDGKEG